MFNYALGKYLLLQIDFANLLMDSWEERSHRWHLRFFLPPVSKIISCRAWNTVINVMIYKVILLTLIEMAFIELDQQ